MAILPVPKDLAAVGFTAAPTDIKYRLLLGTQGRDKTGKSRFWMTAPAPIGVINLDIGLEGVIEQWAAKKTIWPVNFNVPPVVITHDGAILSVDQKKYGEIWKRIMAAYERLLTHSQVRTVVVDDGSVWWDLAIMAEFGTTQPRNKDQARAFSPLNQLFRSLVKMAYDSDKNLIITHKMKEKWVNKETLRNNQTVNQDVWDGSYKRAGFKDDAYLIQANIEHTYSNEEGFKIEVINCRQNMGIAGYRFGQDECTFQDVATAIFDGTDKKDWE